jgi:hypothetical protein
MLPLWVSLLLMRWIAEHSRAIGETVFVLVLAWLLANFVYGALLDRWFKPQRARELEQIRFPRICQYLDNIFVLKSTDILADEKTRREQAGQNEVK